MFCISLYIKIMQKYPMITADRLWVWTVQVFLDADSFFIKIQSSTVNVFSLYYFSFSSLLDSKNTYIIHITYKICVNQCCFCCCYREHLVNSRLLAVKFLENQVLYVDFWLYGESASLTPLLVEGQLYSNTWRKMCH